MIKALVRGGILLLLALSPSSPQDSFEEFLKEELSGFEKEKEDFKRYLEEVNREFEEYKKIVYEEFNRFKEEASRYWDEPEVSTQKKWVQYSEDLKTKRVADFEKGEIRIEVVSKKPLDKEVLKRELKEFVKQDMEGAFKEDRLLSRIESKVSKKLRHIKRGKLSREPVLAPLVAVHNPYGEQEIEKGIEELIKTASIKTFNNKKGYRVNRLVIKLPPQRIIRKAKQIKPYVEREAQRRKLPESLIFAIIHTESSFNPFATSHIPAYGLMQVVPQTAGKEVSRFLWGKPVILSPSYLYNPSNNVMIGSTYFHLLYYKYFRGVKNPRSRLYLSIAAYNTGPGNVARALTGYRNIKRAVKVANRMDPNSLYNRLLRRLPFRETRDYLRKVTARIAIYRNF